MKYEKPELVKLASAANAIQGGKGDSSHWDNSQYTVAAYQADE